MFCDVRKDGMPGGLLNSCDVPRSIFWISTKSKNGTANLAPYSFSSAIAYDPPQVMFAVTGLREDGKPAHTLVNARECGEFVVNTVPHALREKMNQTATAVGPEVDEFKLANLIAIQSQLVEPPGVKQSPIRLECRVYDIRTLLGNHNTIVIGEVIGIHINDDICEDGKVSWTSYQPVARLGRADGYTHVQEQWLMQRPRGRGGSEQ